MTELSKRARSLAASLEAVAGQVYFSPECHDGYAELGFDQSPGEMAGVALPEMHAYFTSRGSVMGQVPGEVVAAAFGVFNVDLVVPAVEGGWKLTDANTICDARDRGAVGQLERILGSSPEGVDTALELLTRANADLVPNGKPLYAGVASLELIGTPLGDCWRQADRLREYRGDAHNAAWTAAGHDACEIGLLSELSWGMPARSYSRSRGWSDAHYEAAEARLLERGLVEDGQLTEEGRAAREAIEAATDRQCAPFIDALGEDLEALIAILASWSAEIRAGHGYPSAGPHDLADLASTDLTGAEGE